jgi:hypothetical protein
MVAGEPGLSDCRLSDEESVRRPRNFRTDDGRLCGLVGDSSVLLAASLVRGLWNGSSAIASSCPLPFVPLLSGKTSDCGVGCDDKGPFPGVGGRGDSGGESSGAGIDVPSVSEKLIGVRVSGLYLLPAMMSVGFYLRRVMGGAIGPVRERLAARAYVLVLAEKLQSRKQAGSSGGAQEWRVDEVDERAGISSALHNTRRTRRGCVA